MTAETHCPADHADLVRRGYTECQRCRAPLSSKEKVCLAAFEKWWAEVGNRRGKETSPMGSFEAGWLARDADETPAAPSKVYRGDYVTLKRGRGEEDTGWIVDELATRMYLLKHPNGGVTGAERHEFTLLRDESPRNER